MKRFGGGVIPFLLGIVVACGGARPGDANGNGAPDTNDTNDTDGGAENPSSEGNAKDAAPQSDAGNVTDHGTSGGGGTNDGASANAKPVNPWNVDVSGMAVEPTSAAMIAFMDAQGSFGGNHKFQIDPTLTVVRVPDATAVVPYAKTANYAAPDCDDLSFPLPAAPTWSACGGDCDFIVRMGSRELDLFGTVSTSPLTAGCLAVWDLSKIYPDSLRGDQCTSADAAGLPKAAMALDPDEIASGTISHAIRLVLPNSYIRKGLMVRPATHAGVTDEMSTSSDAIPYGARFRLKAGFDLSKLPSDGGRVIARALQKYGVILADGGEIPLTGLDDTYTTAKWATVVSEGSHELFAITTADLEVITLPKLETVTFKCVRNPLL